MPVGTCLSIRVAAARVGIHADTLRRRIAAGAGPEVTRIGGRVMIREDRLDAWLNRNTRQESAMASAPARRSAADGGDNGLD